MDKLPAREPKPLHMRPSRVLAKTRAGGVAGSLKLNTLDPRAAEMFAMSGIDCLWLCTEHVPANYADMENMVRAAKLHDVDTVVRVPRGSYTDHIRGLEMDASGIMVPHVMNLADAEDVVRMTKFPPLGRRAVDGGNADGAYCRIPAPQYLQEANRERFVIHQIEDPEVLPDLERIAELPGVDMLLFGPGDYSVSIGRPGEVSCPEVMKIKERVATVARAAGKMAGVPATPDNVQQAIDMGYNFVNMGSDVGALTTFSDRAVSILRDLKLPA